MHHTGIACPPEKLNYCTQVIVLWGLAQTVLFTSNTSPANSVHLDIIKLHDAKHFFLISQALFVFSRCCHEVQQFCRPYYVRSGSFSLVKTKTTPGLSKILVQVCNDASFNNMNKLVPYELVDSFMAVPMLECLPSLDMSAAAMSIKRCRAC